MTDPSSSADAVSSIADHPSLKPALHLRVAIGNATQVGSLSRGTPLTVVPLVSASLDSEPGFPISIHARNRGHGGVDYVRNDPDGKRMRLTSDLVVG